MRTKWATIAIVAFLVLLPFLLLWAYRRTISALPSEVVIATGPPDGKYEPLMRSLAKKIETKLRIKVNTLRTKGSVENLLLLQTGKADFGPSQAGALENTCRLDPTECEKVRSSLPSGNEEIAFVANLYMAPVSLIVRQGAGIRSPADLRGKSVRLGVPGSGDYAMSLMLLEHFGLDTQSIHPKYLEYPEVKKAFLDRTIDAALITFSVHTTLFPELFQTGKVALLSIPNAEAFATRHVYMSPYRIPAGLYSSHPPIAPETDIRTVAINVELLARANTNPGLVEEVTKIVLSEEFQKENQLHELFVRGREFARERAEFAIHKGALRVYETNPLLDPDVIDIGVKGLSFTLSFIIAMISGIQWMKHRRAQKKAYKLDEFMRSLLDIERRQILLMADPTCNSYQHLEKLLEEVTRLRHQALRKFTARELNEDRAVDSFLEICHGISNEIHGRLLRARVGANEGLLGAELPSVARHEE